ncbi:MAG TPA: antitoxin VapB family protein [Candidatus Krumholzibacteriaceae bacterium]|nr:antitoxin VapB family protein [Candidatus Krumholzibacteriaceae bacterium]
MTKTLTIRDEVYERLLKIKREDESFSDLFMRLSEEENTLMLLERLRGSIDLPEADEIIEEIYQKRVERRYASP